MEPTPASTTALPDSYKWTALSNTTLGVFLVTLNASVVIISLPAIFRGIHLNPLQPANISFLLWVLMSYMVVTAVLVVTFGRIGDMLGRARMYNTGFVVFSIGALGLALVPGHGSSGALELIAGRVVQGVGGALLMSNANAILTDAFPVKERGMALGINSVAAIAGSFLGLIVGGLLASVEWRLVFLVSVPVAVIGSIWGIAKLKDVSPRYPAKIDWWGNVTFAAGLVAVMVGITYGIQPYGGHTMGWTNPLVIVALILGLGLLASFVRIEHRAADPLFHLELFRIRAFAAAGAANVLASMGRGGLQFILIIWLQGIWLPLHGYDFARTPLWAGIYMIPLSAGFLLSGPLSGWLSDHYGGRRFATGGMVLGALTFAALMAMPADFGYPTFAAAIFFNGIGFGLFSAPNSMSIMNAVPARHRGSASGVLATFMNGGFVLSMGVFFSLMIVGLAAHLPHVMKAALIAHGVPAGAAAQAAALPPVGSLFAAFLGYNPMRTLLGSTLHTLPAAQASLITGKSFFPSLMARPFHDGLLVTFSVAMAMCLLSAAASWLAGGGPSPRATAAGESADGTSGAGPEGGPAEPDESAEAATQLTGAQAGFEADAMEAVPSGGAGRL